MWTNFSLKINSFFLDIEIKFYIEIENFLIYKIIKITNNNFRNLISIEYWKEIIGSNNLFDVYKRGNLVTNRVWYFNYTVVFVGVDRVLLISNL